AQFANPSAKAAYFAVTSDRTRELAQAFVVCEPVLVGLPANTVTSTGRVRIGGINRAG
ncbi:MAG: hypothetical protein ACI89G_003195, partial [Minisyncoccia bacterium]